MTSRSAIGLLGAMLFPAGLGFLWYEEVKSGRGDPWSIFWLVPALIVLGIPGGFVLGWFGMALLQGFIEERVTRAEMWEENDDRRYEID